MEKVTKKEAPDKKEAPAKNTGKKSAPAGPAHLVYRGKPLVREGNFIYYGKMTDPFVLFLMIMSYRKINETEVPDKVLVQVLSTDDKLSPHEKIHKQGEKSGLYDALDVGAIWLDRAISG